MSKRILHGRVVTMDKDFTVLPRGAIFIDGNRITAVQEIGAPPPDGFADVTPIDTNGTIYPGLIELHNHITYNILKLWDVPETFPDRGGWRGSKTKPVHEEYWQLVKEPMSQINGLKNGCIPAAIARYVEAKCLFSGVTTTQGLSISKNGNTPVGYRGIVRNVEDSNDSDLAPAAGYINDVHMPECWDDFNNELTASTSFLPHVAEGGPSARKYFKALKKDGTWALNEKLTGIHCCGLEDEDFAELAKHRASMVWSPLSNLLLYGLTANVGAALKHGLKLSLGSDWSPSGSKNLLGELKVARIMRDHDKLRLRDEDLVAMVTINPATRLKWDKHLGSIETCKRADLLVLNNRADDPYSALIDAMEDDIALVLVDGTPMHGYPDLMQRLGAAGEAIRLATTNFVSAFTKDNSDSRLPFVSFGDAQKLLTCLLRDIPTLAKTWQNCLPEACRAPKTLEQSDFRLVLEMDPDDDVSGTFFASGSEGCIPVRPKLPDPLPSLIPLELDAATYVDDPTFMAAIDKQRNLPDYVKEGLRKFYG